MLRQTAAIKSDVRNRILTLSVTGDIDHHSAKKLRERADELLLSERPVELVLDLSAVHFMDSSGLGFILGRYTRAEDIGASMTLRDPDERTMKILSLAGIERMISISFSDRQAEKRTGSR